ncbi:hypothetical protein AWB80_02851 [Caballeronia pedi]|uniref:Uncharacterized protein n=1 Tax=Caballeronia pedi TaxID=1777141 RepID=A0A158AZR0_9BURK|nr:hypothetical protein AWB80_02851 [Caballeronia pedi]
MNDRLPGFVPANRVRLVSRVLGWLMLMLTVTLLVLAITASTWAILYLIRTAP